MGKKTKIIDGKEYKVIVGGYSSDRKSTAKKKAKKLREQGYSARVISRKQVIGRVKRKGKTFKVFKKTLHTVYYRKK